MCSGGSPTKVPRSISSPPLAPAAAPVSVLPPAASVPGVPPALALPSSSSSPPHAAATSTRASAKAMSHRLLFTITALDLLGLHLRASTSRGETHRPSRSQVSPVYTPRERRVPLPPAIGRACDWCHTL